MDKRDWEVPIVVYALKGTFNWGDKLPACPFEHGCYLYSLWCEGKSYEVLDQGKDVYLDNKSFINLKKPGLFQKKILNIELFWILKSDYNFIALNFQKIQGQDRKTHADLPVFLSASVNINYFVGRLDKAMDFAKKMGKTIQPGTVLLKKRDIVDFAIYSTKYSLGDIYNAGFLKANQVVVMHSNLRHGSDTSFEHKVAEILSDNLEASLGNLGLEKPGKYAFTYYSKIRTDI